MQIFPAVSKIPFRRYRRKIIRNPVGIDLGIQCQLIDQNIHFISFIIYCLNVSVHPFGGIRNPVHDSFHISFDRRDRCFQIVGNITDQLLVLPVECNLLFRVRLQPKPHLLKILTELSDLIIRLLPDLKIKIPFLDISCRLLQFRQRNRNRTVDPINQQRRCDEYDNHIKLLKFSYFPRRERMHHYIQKDHRQNHNRHKCHDQFCPKLHRRSS